jgi:hypothetical protein
VFLFRRQPDQTFAAAEVFENSAGQVVMHRRLSVDRPYPRPYNVTALAYDWDDDGDADLLLGHTPLWLVLNEGTAQEPSFDGGRLIECDGKPILGGLASHQMVDWDGDGLDDLLAGNVGSIVWYRNVGQRGNPKFESPRMLVPRITSSPGQERPAGRPGSLHAFYVADFNADGRRDLLVGDRGYGKVVATGEDSPEWTDVDNARLSTLWQQYEDLRDEPKSETRAERIERYRKVLRTWQDRETLRLARDAAAETRYEYIGCVWFCERIAPEGQKGKTPQ